MNNKFLFIPQWHNLGTASIPESNYQILYPKSTDGEWYFVKSDGSEKRIEIALDFVNGVNVTPYGTSSVLKSRIDIAIGQGLTFAGNYAGSTISVFNVTPSMLSSINTGTAGYVLVSNGDSFVWITSSQFGSGTGPNGATGATGPQGNMGATGPSVNYDNGLEIIGGTVLLGGTLSINTLINANNFDLTIISASTILLNTSIFDLEADGFVSIDAGTGSVQIYADDTIVIAASSSVDIVSNGDVNITFSQSSIVDSSGNGYGLVYSSDYSATFVTNSLVNKSYVDSQISGITSSGNANVSNGLSIINNVIELGGTLSATTSINTNIYGFFIGGSGQIGITSSNTLNVSSYNYTTFFVIDPTTEFSAGLLFTTASLVVDDSISQRGLVYNDDYTANFVTHSLITKGYLETTTSNYLPLSGGTISGSLVVDGNLSVLNNLTASTTYISSTGSNTLTLYSSGTGSTIFRVQGRSGELFSIVDGLTGSLFSVNDISGLPILEVFSDDTILMGDYNAPALNTTVKVTTVTGSNVIYSINKSTYTGAFFEYTLTKNTNARAGSIMSVWSGTTASYTETSTADIGVTTDVTFVVSATGSDAIITASASSNNWVIKTIIRTI